MTDRLSTLQDFPLAAGIQAIKDSLAFDAFDDFYRHLLNNLPQNSPQTRSRYASLVVRWFFLERRLDGLLPSAWRAYGDEHLLQPFASLMLETTPICSQ